MSLQSRTLELPSVIGLDKWVEQVAELTEPLNVVWCDGSTAEYNRLVDEMVAKGTLIRLNHHIRPNSYLARTDPKDVARVEERTFICSTFEEDAGPTNNWMSPREMKDKLTGFFAGSMRGRTMYVVPFAMGPIGSALTKYGVQITDSAYAVVNMHIMTRVTPIVFDDIRWGAQWVGTMHSVGSPLTQDENGNWVGDSIWPSNEEKYISHFPETREVWSFGSGYGGNALLGKKCMSLRIGSTMARDEGWLAEHMLLMRLESPEGKRYHLSAAFPSACGKTNLAMLQPSLPGWKVETFGDDIAWIGKNEKGHLRAINPENGFFGVAPGTSMKTNPVAMQLVAKDTIFTNVALTQDGDVWWEGMTKNPPEGLIDWQGNKWDPTSGKPAAHPNGRFTSPARNCPTISDDWQNPEGIVLDAIIFGGRRATGVPLVAQSRSWAHGVYMGATMASEQTAAAEGVVGKVRRDPFAMLPFAGYNMADYWGHWLSMKKGSEGRLPQIFKVNWFLKNKDGQFIWPGFSENARVLKWIIERLEHRAIGQVSPVGLLPLLEELGIEELDISKADAKQLVEVDTNLHAKELLEVREYFDGFAGHVPEALWTELETETRLTLAS